MRPEGQLGECVVQDKSERMLKRKERTGKRETLNGRVLREMREIGKRSESLVSTGQVRVWKG